MTAATTLAYDAMSVNVPTLPVGQHAGYTTGLPVGYIEWLTAQWVADPGAVRICQDAGATDDTADILDVESGAATPAEVPGWAMRARASFSQNRRPGQRWPGVYCSQNSLTAIANALAAAKITGVPIWLADPGISQAEAQNMIVTASGPIPVTGVQFAWHSTFDTSLFLTTWLTHQSGVKGNTVQAGNAGPAVLAAQELLNASDKTTKVQTDGLFGALTEASVKTFQHAAGLTADGIVGPKTWAALEAAPPPPPAAPLSLKSSHSTLTRYFIQIDRNIPGYTGHYITTVSGPGHVLSSIPLTEGIVTVEVSAPGTYTVMTDATGYTRSVATIAVS